MTTNDIDAIRARANAAEDGPWRVVEEHGRDIADEAYTRLTIQTDGPGRSREIAELVDPEHSWSSQLPEENAAFIAFARTLVPALCDEIEQLRARLAATEPAELTDEPGPEVTRVTDDDGDLWIRSPEGWRLRTSNGDGDPWKWAGIASLYGPLKAVES